MAEHPPTGSGLQTFFRIIDAWGLDDDEARHVLGSPDDRLWAEWRGGRYRNGNEQVRLRVGHVLAVYAALQRLVGTHEAMRTWLRGINHSDAFDGTAPIQQLTLGSIASLASVREYLDAQFEWG